MALSTRDLNPTREQDDLKLVQLENGDVIHDLTNGVTFIYNNKIHNSKVRMYPDRFIRINIESILRKRGVK